MRSARLAPFGFALHPFRWLLAVVFFLAAQGLQVGAQSCGFEWQWRNPTPGGGMWMSVAAGDAGYVAAGEVGLVAASPDGLAWTPVRPFTNGSIWAVAWGNGRYLAVSSYGPEPVRLWSSQDGTTWVPLHEGQTPIGRVTFEGGRFFNLHQAQVYVSQDGVQWTPVDLGVPVTYVASITYGAGLYVVLADQGAIFTSTDTQTWTARRPSGSSSLRYLEFGNSVFVAVGNQGQVITSVDGATWSEAAPPTTGSMNGLFFAAGRFFSATDDSTIITSRDGVHWDFQATPFTYIVSMASRPEDTVATGSIDDPVLGRIWGMAQTYDGITWRRIDSSATRSDLNAAASGGSPETLVAVGNGGTIITTVGDSPFTLAATPTTADLRGAAWGAGRFVAVGVAGQILTSEDGAFWTQRPSGVSTDLWGVRWLNGLFLCTGEGGTLLTSPDGILWSRQDSGTQAGLLCSTWGAGRFVVAGRGMTVLSSIDAVHWTLTHEDASSGNYLVGIAYGNGVFSAVGCCSNYGLVSGDGVTWTRLQEYVSAADVTFWAGQFVAVRGGSTECLISQDGGSWTQLYSAWAALMSLASYRGHLVGVGAKGAILEADCGPALTGLSPVHGSTLGGDAVTLTGMALGGVQAVYFGGTPAASYTVVSDERIDAVTPPGNPDIVQVSVLAPEGYSPWSWDCRFQYFLPPYIQSVNPAKISVLGGEVNLTGNNLNSGTEAFVDGYRADCVIQQDGSFKLNVLPHPAGTVDVTVRNNDGQTATLENCLTFVEPPIIQKGTVIRRPVFKLKLTGTGFHPRCVVMVDEQPAPTVKNKSSSELVVKGASVARLFNPGHHWVPVRIVNTDDGISGPTFRVPSD